MKFRSYIFTVLLCLAALAVPSQRAVAQDNPDDKPHIQPRSTPTPTPSPTPSPTPQASQQKPADNYERPPFPGDAPGTEPAPKTNSGDKKYERPPFPGDAPGANEPSPKRSDKTYERPPFPGDAPGSNPTGGSATGESSSRDSQINLDAQPREEPAPAKEDESVLQPWDPHKAAKDVEVGQYYLKLKNYRAALERFNHALTYKPDDAEAIYGLAYTQEKLDLLSLADQNYHKYLAILPNGPRSKDAEEGLKRIAPNVAMRNTSVSNADPSRVAAHDIDVGETYLSGNHFDAARERFEDALRLTPDNPLIFFRLAQALQGMQQLDPARLYYRKYLESQPKGKFAGNAKKAISQIDWILGK
ncbi:MAG TPA: tetratricopeptide repeat protein [Candidatus Angelobacter sp.]|jgi:Tfp pilus assembly protein PilF